MEIEELQLKMEILLAQLDTIEESDEISKYGDTYTSAVNSYVFQTLTQADIMITSMETEKDTVEASLKLYRILKESYSSNEDIHGEPISVSLQSVEEMLETLNNIELSDTEIARLSANIQDVEREIDSTFIRAQQSGKVNVITNIAEGDYVNAGTSIATIIPLDDEYKVLMYVRNSDIALILLCP